MQKIKGDNGQLYHSASSIMKAIGDRILRSKSLLNHLKFIEETKPKAKSSISKPRNQNTVAAKVEQSQEINDMKRYAFVQQS